MVSADITTAASIRVLAIAGRSPAMTSAPIGAGMLAGKGSSIALTIAQSTGTTMAIITASTKGVAIRMVTIAAPDAETIMVMVMETETGAATKIHGVN